MRILIFAFVMIFCVTEQAWAQNQTEKTNPCKIIENLPKQDALSADYKPGVDVHGKPVVGADVNAGTSPIGIPDVMVVPLTVDIAERLNLPTQSGVKMEGTLGFLEIGRSGAVRYNGQDLTDKMMVLCDEGDENTLQTDGQSAEDVIKSQSSPADMKNKQ